MKIKYIHWSDPDTEKIIDTVESLKNCASLIRTLGPHHITTQEEWDKKTIALMERDMKKGFVLSYEILEEGK